MNAIDQNLDNIQIIPTHMHLLLKIQVNGIKCCRLCVM